MKTQTAPIRWLVLALSETRPNSRVSAAGDNRRDVKPRPDFANVLADQELTDALRAVMYARQPQKIERWVAVMHVFHCGSTVAKKLCKRFGFEPYGMVAGNSER